MEIEPSFCYSVLIRGAARTRLLDRSIEISWMSRFSRRGVVYAAALATCWYLAFFTELEDNTIALCGMILFLCFLYGFLWPKKVATFSHYREGGVQQLIPESGLRRVPEAIVDQPVRKAIASQSSADTSTSGGPGDGRHHS